MRPIFQVLLSKSIIRQIHNIKATESRSVRNDIGTMMSVLRQMLSRQEKGSKYRIFGGMFLLIGGKALNVQIPGTFKSLIDRLEIEHLNVTNLDISHMNIAMTQVGTILLAYFGVRLGSSIFSELRNVVFSSVSQEALKSVALSTFRHLHRLDYSFHASTNTGALSRMIDRGIRGMNFLLTTAVFNIAPTIVEIGMVCAILSYKFGIGYAGVAAGTLASYAVFTFSVTSWRGKFRQRMNASETAASGTAYDSLIHHDVVKECCGEEREATEYDLALKEYQKSAQQTAQSLAVLNTGQQSILSLSVTAIMAGISNSLLIGTAGVSIGDLVLANGLLMQLALPLNFLGSIWREARQSLIDIDVAWRISNQKPNIQESADARQLVTTNGGIQLSDVKFLYSTNTYVYDEHGSGDNISIFKGLNLDVLPGKVTAIVGPSGCGKSTILKLLLRFKDPQSGKITIDGTDISKVTLNSLRQQVAVVQQDASLFNRSIRYNIAYGRAYDISSVTDDEIYEAAKTAQIHNTIMGLPKGYDTVVGERGSLLSGGERQRIVLARALVKQAPILLLDEATSSLDMLTEKAVMNNIFESRRTVLIIAHRLSTVENADIIYVFGDRGEGIVEKGKHKDLIAQKGLYWCMWSAQKRVSGI